MPVPASNVPNPDPTERTTVVMHRELEILTTLLNAKMDAINIRIDGIDRATVVFREEITRVPTEVDKAIDRLRELITLQVKSIELQVIARLLRAPMITPIE